jgi:hypothetical protein
VAIITKSSDDARLIRRLAIWSSAVMWFIGTASGLVRGLNVANAATLGGMIALGGLVAWLIYHALSRRNNGIAIFGVAAIGALPSSHTVVSSAGEAFAREAVTIVGVVITSAGIGACLRSRGGQDKRPTQSPLWDAEVDRPGPG